MSLTTERKKYDTRTIEEIANKVLLDLGISTFPVNPLVIAKNHDISVINAEFHEDGISGMVNKENGEITIYVNHQDPPNRKKFTIAHELGHVFLHLQDGDGNFIDHDVNLFRQTSIAYQENEQLYEIEANHFAAALLMPKNLIVSEWERTFSVDGMAARFGVSKTAMGYRLQNIGLL